MLALYMDIMNVEILMSKKKKRKKKRSYGCVVWRSYLHSGDESCNVRVYGKYIRKYGACYHPVWYVVDP